ncbi:MAG: hypothetical protein V1790_03190 [Planctomycetota bacterium]
MTNEASGISTTGGLAMMVSATGRDAGRVCPSVCPSDWDKRKTP